MTRSQSGVLHTQFCLMAAHSSGNLTISVDGSDFNAVSLTSPAPDDLEEAKPKRAERQSHVALALGSSADSAAWSSSLLVSLEPESFFKIVRNEVILVPVYNASMRANDCFYPIRVDTKSIDGVDTIVFSPFAVLTNSLREAILVNSAGFVRSIEPGESCPYMTRQMDNRTDRFVFAIKGVSQGSYSWSDEAKLIEDSTDFVLVTSVCFLFVVVIVAVFGPRFDSPSIHRLGFIQHRCGLPSLDASAFHSHQSHLHRSSNRR